MRRSIATLALVAAASGTAVAANGPVSLELRSPAPQVARGAQVEIIAEARVEPGWHINSHQPAQRYLIPTELSLTVPPGVSAGPVQYPDAVPKRLKFAGGKELLLYEGTVPMRAALRVPEDYPGRRVRVEARLRYQACNDTTCLPPQTVAAEAFIPVAAREHQVREGAFSLATLPRDGASGLGGMDRLLEERGLLVTLLGMLALGLALNLTPCVYPLISVTVAYFGGQARSRGRLLVLAVVYVFGIALSFSFFGVAAALSGGLFGAALQRPETLLFIAGVLVVLALGSFGVYQFRPPAALMRLAGSSAGGLAGALFMGLTMGIVAAPCVGPIVLGLLIFVGTHQDPVLGFALFFFLALGMGLPYVALALAAGAIGRLPRSGEWLAWTERLFGCVLLVMAAYFVRPLLPAALKPLLLPVAVGLSAIYLGFVDRSGNTVRHFPWLKRAVGISGVAAAVAMAIPATPETAIAWESAQGPRDLSAAIARGQPVLIDFAAEWCIPCREMEHTTYTDPEVVNEARRFRMIKVDLTEENEETKALTERFDVRGVPTVILLSSDGREQARLVGYVGPDELLEAMRRVG